jgi:hypothetical protein
MRSERLIALPATTFTPGDGVEIPGRSAASARIDHLQEQSARIDHLQEQSVAAFFTILAGVPDPLT